MGKFKIHRLPIESVKVDPKRGLTCHQAQLRRSRGWGNVTSSDQSRSVGQILLQNFVTFFNLVFVVLALILALCGSSVKNMAFMLVVIINAAIGCIQEIRAKRALDKLSLVAAQTITCIRDGRAQSVRSDLLVLDDIVEFGPGDQICADAVVCSGNMQVNESLLTGEADAISKKEGDELLSGSFVVAGRCRARLTKVGDDTFAARLAAEAKKNPKVAKSEMMRSLDKLIRFAGILLVPIGLVLFFHELKSLELPLRDSAEATVAALVGMIPQGLYLLTTVALAASAIKLTTQKVLVQDMNCIEALARVDVLCVDKTGTITEPAMQVEAVIPLSQEPPEYLKTVLTALYGSREPDNDTARAIKEMYKGESDWKCSHYVPFSSQTKWCGATFRDRGSFLAGAPEFIMGDRYLEIKDAVGQWTADGYRVLLIARYGLTGLPEQAVDPAMVVPLALIPLKNRIRENAPKTFAYFAQQGVAIKVISGDNPATVSEVARRAGIENAEKYIDATTLETPEQLERAAEEYTVFGRVTPDQKKQLILALKKHGHTVGMTGDGVNDVLALKEADCGIAMAGGAQAATQVARLVLLDSDFTAMPGIVGEGRRVINNIQRAAALFILKNIFSLVLALVNILAGLPFPLAPLHLTLISTLTIGTPSFFLALEPNYERVNGRFLPGVIRKALPGALVNIIVVLFAQIILTNMSLPFIQVQTLCTAAMAIVGLLVLLQVCKPFTTLRKLVLGAMTAGVLICFVFLRSFFHLELEVIPFLPALFIMLIVSPVLLLGLEKLTNAIYHHFQKK